MVSIKANCTQRRRGSPEPPGCLDTAAGSVGSVLTWLSRPKVNSMKKNRKDQNGERGSIVMAWGYTTKARPGPRGGKGQQGEKRVTALGRGGWRRGQPRRAAPRWGPARALARWAGRVLQQRVERCRRTSLLLAQTFIRHHLVLLKVCTAGMGLPPSLPLAS